uniref:Exonuclease 1 n=1 Tax=Panagrellus redivivus TaxID=6233 RepID=A0A7E4W7Y1_PANRE
MGIKTLLPSLKRAFSPGSIEAFANKTIGVDISCILHRAFSGCAQEVARNETSDFYITFVRRYIDLLLRYNCHVILVYDGQPLPSKRGTNASRTSRRESNLQKAEALVLQGNSNEAYKYFQSATSITSVVVEHTIAEFSKIPNVDILVAPYEADAQLAYLMKHNIADAVVTDDSDLILFGCSTLIYKLNWNTGSCEVYELSKLPLCFSGYMRRKFSFDTFRYLCIIMGCDYFPGISKVGFKKGVEFFDCNRGTNLVKMLKQDLNAKFSAGITDEDVQGFLTANFTFLYQVVYCPLSKKEVAFTERPDEYPLTYAPYLKRSNLPVWHFAGSISPEEDSCRKVLGNRDTTVDPKLDKYKRELLPKWSVHHPEKFAGRAPTADADVVFLSSQASPAAGAKRTHSATTNTGEPVRVLFTPPQAKVPRTQQTTAFTTQASTIQPRVDKTQSQPVSLRSPATNKKPPASIWGRLSAQVVKKNSQESPQPPVRLNTFAGNSVSLASQDSITEKLVNKLLIQHKEPIDERPEDTENTSKPEKPSEIVPETQVMSVDKIADEPALLKSSDVKATPDKEAAGVDENAADKSTTTPDSSTATPKRRSRHQVRRFDSFAQLEILHRQMPLISPVRVEIPRSRGSSSQSSPKPGTSSTPIKRRLTVSPLETSSRNSPEAVKKFFSPGTEGFGLTSKVYQLNATNKLL